MLLINKHYYHPQQDRIKSIEQSPSRATILNDQSRQKRHYSSNRPEVFYEKNVLKNFAKFTEKHRYQDLFFNKVAVDGIQLC